jgi:2',3'-cyclic-nucleotide 2'-phosphodiesterase (5'-nucleotidase family)
VAPKRPLAEAAIEYFESVGVDAIIGLTHLYMRDDRRLAELRARHPKFVFIVGGHDHELEYSPLSDRSAAVMKGAFGAPTADLACINGGTLRIDDWTEDDILFEDIARTFGFSSFLRYTTITGAEFRKVMEAVYRGSGMQGYFPQVSGFRICVDRSRNDGDRIVSLQVPVDNGWAEIEAETEYDLVVPDYLYSGGDGYQIPRDRPASRPGSELKYLVLDAILKAQAEGLKIGKPVEMANPRFVELGEDHSECLP